MISKSPTDRRDVTIVMAVRCNSKLWYAYFSNDWRSPSNTGLGTRILRCPAGIIYIPCYMPLWAVFVALNTKSTNPVHTYVPIHFEYMKLRTICTRRTRMQVFGPSHKLVGSTNHLLRFAISRYHQLHIFR